MSLSEWADIATIAASALAVLGIGWLIYIHLKRHQKVWEDYKVIVEEMKGTTEYAKELHESIPRPLPESHDKRLEWFIVRLASELEIISMQLRTLQLIGMAQFFRRYDADEEIASILTKWELRSPITRKEQEPT